MIIFNNILKPFKNFSFLMFDFEFNVISNPHFGIGEDRYFSSKTFPEIFSPRSRKNQAVRDNFLGNAQQSRLLIFIYFSSSMSPHRDHASMRLCRFPFLHTDFVLFLDISMIFFSRNAILCLQFLSLIQTPSCWNNQNQIKHLQKHYTTDRYSSNDPSTRSLISRRGSH